FTVSLSPQSISTFTTHPGAGGNAGNTAPIAMVGEDATLVDEDLNGVEKFVLDGTLSSDVDGSITNFSWSVDGVQVSSKMLDSVDLALGNHEIVLTVTDNDGARSSDVMLVE